MSIFEKPGSRRKDQKCCSDDSICYSFKMKLLFSILKIASLVSVYFCFSIGLTFYQKWFVVKFQFPLTIVTCHLMVKYLLASFSRTIYEVCTKKNRIILKWKDYVMRIGSIGFFCAIDIGFSNWSFEFITVSLYTMSKSTCIIFILFFSIIFGLQKMSMSLVAIVLLISGGLFLFTYHSTQFNLEGFILIMIATLSSGLRWTLSQLVMQKNEIGLTNPLDMVFHVQPWMVLSLAPLAVGFEGESIAKSVLFRYDDPHEMLYTVGLLLIGAGLAFLMEISEYLLVSWTSSLTLSISGILKEILTLVLAVKVNHDQLTTVNVIGLALCLLGIITHVILKIFDSDKPSKKQKDFELAELLSNDEDSDEDDIFDQRFIR